MKRVVALCLFAAALVFVEPGRTTADGDVLSQAVKSVEAFHDALQRGDAAGAQALLADDVHIYEQGWVERSKAEYASHHLASDIKFAKATKRNRTARNGAVSGDLATVTSEERVSGAFDGKPVDSYTLETMVLRRVKDRWLITHIHWSSRAAKK